MSSLIVLGAQHDQVPMILRAREMGLEVIGVEYSPNPPARRHCNHFYCVSYRDMDSIRRIAQQHRVIGIGTSGTNDAIVTASKITHELGLPGLYDRPEIIVQATYKHLWRDRLEQSRVPVAWGSACDSLSEAEAAVEQIGYPVLVKPTDSSGCKGLHVVTTKKHLQRTLLDAKRFSETGRMLVEKFISHNSFAVESFVVDGHAHLLGIAERKLPPFPLCISMGSTLPDRLSHEQRQAVLDANQKAINALSLSYGPVHIDMVFDEDWTPHIVDVGPRCVGGPLGWALIPAATGFQMVEAVVGQSIGKAIRSIRVLHDGRFHAHRHLTVDKRCILEAIRAERKLMDRFKILMFHPHVEPGDTLYPIQNSKQRYGNITAWGHSFGEANSNIDAFAERVLLTRIQFEGEAAT